MAEDTKKELYRLSQKHKDKVAAEHAAREHTAHAKALAKEQERQRQRLAAQPPEVDDEDDAAKWVRANLEWHDWAALWVPPYSSYSDYDNSSFVERSNVEVWLRDFPEWFSKETGGYGSVWVGIPENKRLLLGQHPDTFENIKELVEGLNDYPVMDEDVMSQMESEAQWTDWQEYGRDDMRKQLSREAGSPDAEIAALLISDEAMDEAYHGLEWYNYHHIERGGGVHFDEEKAAAQVTDTWILQVAGDEVEKAKKALFAKNLEGRFATAISERWGQEDPALADAALSLTDNSLFNLLELLIGAVDDPDYSWSVNDKEEGYDVLELDDGVLAKAVNYLTSSTVHRARGEGAGQQHLKFESIARQVLEAETPKQFMARKNVTAFMAGDRVRVKSLDNSKSGYWAGVHTVMEKPDSWRGTKAVPVLVRGVQRVLLTTDLVKVNEAAETPKEFMRRKAMRGPSVENPVDFTEVPKRTRFKLASGIYVKTGLGWAVKVGDPDARDKAFGGAIKVGQTIAMAGGMQVYPVTWTREQIQQADHEWLKR